jgi:hypothetical protein
MHIPLWLLLLAGVVFCWKYGRTPRPAILFAVALGVYLATTAVSDLIRSAGTAAAAIGG